MLAHRTAAHACQRGGLVGLAVHNLLFLSLTAANARRRYGRCSVVGLAVHNLLLPGRTAANARRRGGRVGFAVHNLLLLGLTAANARRRGGRCSVVGLAVHNLLLSGRTAANRRGGRVGLAALARRTVSARLSLFKPLGLATRALFEFVAHDLHRARHRIQSPRNLVQTQTCGLVLLAAPKHLLQRLLFRTSSARGILDRAGLRLQRLCNLVQAETHSANLFVCIRPALHTRRVRIVGSARQLPHSAMTAAHGNHVLRHLLGRGRGRCWHVEG